MPRTTLHNILEKHRTFKSYRYKLLQHGTAKEKKVRSVFCHDFLSALQDDEIFLFKIVFSHEASSFLSSNVNRHNMRSWESNNPYGVISI
jgi:hypothetical protein